MVKRLSTMWETWVRSLGREDSLEKEMATHSSTLALKIPWTEELGAGYYPWGCKESGTTEGLHFLSFFLWTFFGIAFLCDWNESWLFAVLWPLLNLSLVINSVSPVSILCRFWNDISLKPRGFKTGRNLGTALAYPPFSIEKETEVSSGAQAWKWQPTPVLLPGKSLGWRSLVG